MDKDDLPDFTQLISCKDLPNITLQNIHPIHSMKVFMSEPKNANASIAELIKRQEVSGEQCRKVLKVIKERLVLKMATMQELKKYLLDLHSEIRKPGAGTRFVTNQEKVKLHFLDEMEIKEVELSDAVERCNIKLSSLYCEILALDSDMGSVAYLERVAQINIDFIMDWHKTQKQKKTGKVPSAGEVFKNTV
ncbi:uncharacterized protein LOC6735283 isoform X1 [Drosophila simulans]|uniref:GD11470 n=1 Tax=Drosophila simulans TaxID=7240 RepID=B4QE49_DROSI|nr:uncharacterized protein LOC6735283 isoform X1 [Drosophila simulans]EDX07836.1 GD11470 [Drosophila simulans]KMY95165.1 uncharacterized protein Dsimw501_GD11470 [Drosophila simulans]